MILLFRMLNNKNIKTAPLWQLSIDVLFSKHLSAKFAYKGRLEFTDVIKEKFFARKEGLFLEKQMAERFPVFDEILITANHCQKPIYLVNISNDEQKQNTSSISSKKANGE